MGGVVHAAEVQWPRSSGIEPVAQDFGPWAALGGIIAISFLRKMSRSVSTPISASAIVAVGLGG